MFFPKKIYFVHCTNYKFKLFYKYSFNNSTTQSDPYLNYKLKNNNIKI